jgi:tetratricopeptide (TPR) repeat protein
VAEAPPADRFQRQYQLSSQPHVSFDFSLRQCSLHSSHISCELPSQVIATKPDSRPCDGCVNMEATAQRPQQSRNKALLSSALNAPPHDPARALAVRTSPASASAQPNQIVANNVQARTTQNEPSLAGIHTVDAQRPSLQSSRLGAGASRTWNRTAAQWESTKMSIFSTLPDRFKSTSRLSNLSKQSNARPTTSHPSIVSKSQTASVNTGDSSLQSPASTFRPQDQIATNTTGSPGSNPTLSNLKVSQNIPSNAGNTSPHSSTPIQPSQTQLTSASIGHPSLQSPASSSLPQSQNSLSNTAISSVPISTLSNTPQSQSTSGTSGVPSLPSSTSSITPQSSGNSQIGVVSKSITVNASSTTVYLLPGTKDLYIGKMQVSATLADMDSEWHASVRRRLLKDLESVVQNLDGSLKVKDTFTESELRMTGKKKADSASVDLQPTILIRCGSKECRKAIEKKVKKLAYLRIFSEDRIRVVLNAPRQASSRLQTLQDIARTSPDQNFDLSYHVDTPDGSACGMRLSTSVANSTYSRTCTIGGLIRVGEIVYGLTTAHSVVSLDVEYDSDSVDASDSDSDSDMGSFLSFETEQPTSAELSPVRSSPNAALPGETATTPHSVRPFRTAPRYTMSWTPDHVPSTRSVELGPYSYGTRRHPYSPNNGAAASDFALIKLPVDYRALPNIYDLQKTSAGTCTITSYGKLESDEQSDAIWILCSRTDIRSGQLLPGEHAFLSRNAIYSTKKVELEKPLGMYASIINPNRANDQSEQGSSGAWVVCGTKLIGMIIAVYENEPYAHMIEVNTIFSDIKSLLADGESVPHVSLNLPVRRSHRGSISQGLYDPTSVLTATTRAWVKVQASHRFVEPSGWYSYQGAFDETQPWNSLEAMNHSRLQHALAGTYQASGQTREAVELLEHVVKMHETTLDEGHPDRLASQHELAGAYRANGQTREAEAMHRQTLATEEKVVGREHPDTLTSMSNLAFVLDRQGKYEEAEAMNRETLATSEKVLGREHPFTLTSMNNLALVLDRQGKYKEAEAMNRETLAIKEKVLGREHPFTLTSMSNLALVLDKQGKHEEAEMMHRQTLAMYKKVLGREHPSTLMSMNNLVLVLDRQGKYEEAEAMNRETLATSEKVLGREHPFTLMSMNNLALVLDSQGKYEEAEAMHRQTLATKEKVLGREHPFTLTSMSNLALVLDKQGKHEEAEAMHRQTLAMYEKVLGREHPSTLTSMNNLALVLDSQGKYEEAEAMHRQTLATKEKVLGREHPSTLASMHNLASVLDSQGKYEEAEAMHRQTLATKEKVLGREHLDTLASMNNLALVLDSQGKHEETEAMHRQTLAMYEKVLGREHPSTLMSMNNLALVLDSQGKHEEAEAMHRQTLAMYEKVLGREHPSTLMSMNNLASVLNSQGKYKEAEAMHRQELAMCEKVLGREHPDTLTSMNNLANVLNSQGKYEEAEAMHRQELAICEKVLGREHPDTLTSVYCLAHLLAKQHVFEESLNLYQRACKGYSKVLGEHHPTTRACQQHRSEVLKSQEQSSVVFSAPDKSVSAPTRIVSRLSRGLAHLGTGGSKHKKSQEGST